MIAPRAPCGNWPSTIEPGPKTFAQMRGRERHHSCGHRAVSQHGHAGNNETMTLNALDVCGADKHQARMFRTERTCSRCESRRIGRMLHHCKADRWHAC